MPSVKASSSKGKPAKKGKLHHVSVHPAKNGFTVTAHRHPAATNPSMYGGMEDEPSVFTKHSAAHKHVKSLMAEMMPPDGTEEADEMSSSTAGGEMGEGAPVAQVK